MGKQIPVPHNTKTAFLAGFLFCCVSTQWRARFCGWGVHSVNSSPGPFVEAIHRLTGWAFTTLASVQVLLWKHRWHFF